MAAQTVCIEQIRKAAEVAVVTGRTIGECPPEFARFYREWVDAYRAAQQDFSISLCLSSR